VVVVIVVDVEKETSLPNMRSSNNFIVKIIIIIIFIKYSHAHHLNVNSVEAT
jgi:hypothetical protein